MKALIQRVTRASVTVEERQVASIGAGLLVLLGVDVGDDDAQARRLAEKVCRYRVFADGERRMNLSCLDTGGEMLVVSQFTLSAHTAKGLRPSFHTAATPVEGERLYGIFVESVRDILGAVQTGVFGAAMEVSLVNDGPVTFLLE